MEKGDIVNKIMSILKDKESCDIVLSDERTIEICKGEPNVIGEYRSRALLGRYKYIGDLVDDLLINIRKEGMSVIEVISVNDVTT